MNRRARVAVARWRRRVPLPVPPAPRSIFDHLLREMYEMPVLGLYTALHGPALERTGEALPRGVTIDEDDYIVEGGRFAFMPIRKLPPDELRCRHFIPLADCTDPRCVAIVQRFMLR